MIRDLIEGALGETNLMLLPLEQLGNEPTKYFSALSAFLGKSVNSQSLPLARKNSRRLAPNVWQSQAAQNERFERFRALIARSSEIRLSPELKEISWRPTATAIEPCLCLEAGSGAVWLLPTRLNSLDWSNESIGAGGGMRRPLILHIGHHRTGTTTLQKHVFPQLRSVAYFCKDATPVSAQVIDAFGHSPAIWRHRGEEIFRSASSLR